MFFIHLSVDGHLVCFHVFAVVNSVVMNIGVLVSFWFIVLSGYMPGVELLDHTATVFSVFWGTSIQFFIVAAPIYIPTYSGPSVYQGVPKWLSGKESTCQGTRHRFNPWVRKISWRRKWQPTLIFLPGKSHGQKNLMGFIHGVAMSQTQLSDWAGMHAPYTWFLCILSTVSVDSITWE